MNINRVRACGIICLLGASSLVAAGSDQRLVNAAKKGDIQTVRSLLRSHADVNAPLGDGANALAWAAHRDDLETLNLLIRAGANVNAADHYGITPLYLACENGNAAVAESLLKAGANAKIALPSGETALMRAAHTGKVDVVKLLLAHGADVNVAESKRGQTALMWAIAENHVDVIKELLAHGADVRAKTKSGFTVLMFAAQQGNLEAAKILIAGGANVNDVSEQDGTALIVASASGHEDFATFLLSKDANPNAADRYGMTAMHYAVLKGASLGAGVEWYSSSTYLFRPNMPGLVKALLANGANPNARLISAPPLPGIRRLPGITVVGATPYILAAASYDAPLMRILAAGGADPKAMTKENSTALMFAAGLAAGLSYLPPRTEDDDKNAFEAAKAAVELGNDVNWANKTGQTAMHGAAYVGADAIVQFLVDKGAKVNVTESAGQTPLTIAMQYFPPTLLDDNLRAQFAHPKTADLLLKLGATPPPALPAAGQAATRQ